MAAPGGASSDGAASVDHRGDCRFRFGRDQPRPGVTCGAGESRQDSSDGTYVPCALHGFNGIECIDAEGDRENTKRRE